MIRFERYVRARIQHPRDQAGRRLAVHAGRVLDVRVQLHLCEAGGRHRACIRSRSRSSATFFALY